MPCLNQKPILSANHRQEAQRVFAVHIQHMLQQLSGCRHVVLSERINQSNTLAVRVAGTSRRTSALLTVLPPVA